MNLIKVSAVAEILGSTAVVISLIFLLLGIKENTEVARLASYQSIIEQQNLWRYHVTSNPHIAEIFHAASQEEIPTEGSVERTIFNLSVDALINLQEVSFYAYQSGNIGESEWERLLRTICARSDAYTSGTEFSDRILFRLTTEFVTYVEENC